MSIALCGQLDPAGNVPGPCDRERGHKTTVHINDAGLWGWVEVLGIVARPDLKEASTVVVDPHATPEVDR